MNFFPPKPDDGWVMVQHLMDKPKGTSPDRWLNEIKKSANLDLIVTEERLRLNGLPALKVKYRTAPGPEMQEVYVIAGTSTFSIAFSGDKSGTTALENFDNYATYLQMVATFKAGQ